MALKKALSGLLVVLGCVTAMAAVLVRWADAQLHTDAYAEAVGPLLQRPEVKSLIREAVSDALDATGRDVPPVIERTVEKQVDRFVETSLAAELWREATVGARDAVLEGSGSQVTVNVDDIAAELRRRLAERGIDIPAPPESRANVVVMDSPAVARLREAADLTRRLAPVLPIAAGALLLLAVLVAPRKWPAVAASGFGVAVGMGVLLAILPLVEAFAVAELEDERTRTIVVPIYQAFAASLRSDLLWVLVPALVVGVVGLVLAAVTRNEKAERPIPAGAGRF